MGYVVRGVLSQLLSEMPPHSPRNLIKVLGFVRELRLMAFEVGYEVAPEYCQISHYPDEEKCRVRVTLASDREDLPSIKFEAGGRSCLSRPGKLPSPER
uniref:ORF0 protein of RIRE8-like n=1 Tax=Oryza nivara TaxID=4536 RepID=A0A679BE95_ORYNI|nr:ORF0 protein of RIRE8-like [Oryza sativa f. spontanea]